MATFTSLVVEDVMLLLLSLLREEMEVVSEHVRR